MIISAVILLITFIVSMIFLSQEEKKTKDKSTIIINNSNIDKDDLEAMKKDIVKSMAHEFKVNRYLNK
jgi:hypothetical protein